MYKKINRTNKSSKNNKLKKKPSNRPTKRHNRLNQPLIIPMSTHQFSQRRTDRQSSSSYTSKYIKIMRKFQRAKAPAPWPPWDVSGKRGFGIGSSRAKWHRLVQSGVWWRHLYEFIANKPSLPMSRKIIGSLPFGSQPRSLLTAISVIIL